jgi:flagellin
MSGSPFGARAFSAHVRADGTRSFGDRPEPFAMIGAMSSSLSLAQRTATQARATMDDMSRQIATGQKVSSVKDDGAAWARANLARANASATQTLADSYGQIRVGLATAIAIGETRQDVLSDMRGTALAAADASLSAANRQDLQTRYTQMRTAYLNEFTYTAHATAIELRNSGGTSWAPYSATVGFADLTWVSGTDGTTATLAFGSAIAGPSSDVSTSAAAVTTLGNLQSVESQMLQRVAALAALDQRMERDSSRMSEDSARLAALTGRLVDVDLGKVSAARAQADTRQQLALATVRQAITTYGNFAGGLLGNVQRTQRGVLA